MRVRSGSEARLIVGRDVPTLGALQYAQGGTQPVQSVEYRSAGVILSITPMVRDAGIDLRVDQQISDFAKTDTGVNGSPTLTKRSFSTDVTLMDGELVLLGGLTQDKAVNAHSGFSFLPQILQSASLSDSRTEVLLLLQVDRVVRK
jgi:type II secretory pathway component GspD/PulD (secretin)